MFVADRLFIRILEETDLERTHKWINDEDISNAIGFSYPRSIRDQEKWYSSLAGDRSKFVFAICEKEKGNHIGNVSIGNIDYINSNGMFSIFIYGGEHRGKGYGQEATLLLLKFAFEKLNLHKVYLKTTSTQEKALAMYESLGFCREGLFREHEYKDGKFVDKVIFSMLKDEFFQKFHK